MISRVAAATWNEAKNAAGPNSREIIASVFPLPSFFPPLLLLLPLNTPNRKGRDK